MLNRAYIQSALLTVRQGQAEDLNTILKSYRRLRKSIAQMPKIEKEVIAYECGIFNGVYKVFEEISGWMAEQENHQETPKLLGQKQVPEILEYLYKNPDARHKAIAHGVGIAPNYLSEILKLLLKTGYIERYGQHKETRYCLTKMGRLSYKSRIMPKIEEPCYEADYREIRDGKNSYRKKVTSIRKKI